jgi:hypothetical protein
VHAEADTENRLGQRGDDFGQAGPPELVHAVRRGADSGQNDMARGADGGRISGAYAVCPESFERGGQRSNIRATAVDDCDRCLQLSIPLVDGISSLPRRTA